MMELQYLSGVSHTFQTVAVATIIFVACVLLSQVNYRAQLAKLPALVKEGSSEKKRINYLKSGKRMYAEGYEKFKDRIYRMATSDGMDSIVVPPQFLPELRKLPDTVLSFPKAVDETLETKYTKVITDNPMIPHTVKADLTPALVRLNPLICAEVDEAMREEMPPCEDWTGEYIYMKLVNVVAKVSGRVFVGPELCRDQGYLDAGINYTLELMNAQRAIKDMRPWIRPFLAPRLPEVRLLRRRERQATEFLRPVVQARRDAEKNPDYQKPDDMLQWLLNRSVDYKIDSTAQLAKFQLGITFAAIHTTSLTATNVLYSLAASPEYIPPLREEIRAAMAANDGIITSRALQSMEKLDSFMKETIRFNGLGFTSFSRKVLKGITLSNGQYIPPGVFIEVPSHAVYQDSTNYPDSDTFDGFRFAKIRKGGSATDNARNQFVTTNEQNLFFGYGKHACPGRFFAANEIKMILARIILEYDIKNVDGVIGRIPNTETGSSSTPDATKQLMFKKVHT
ncbi:cytochrome P450 monooxygenase-like protein [Melanomma pulvis-pyrius CBS 109.77]|uniref:Cytochrome P450 monooxygenase-like protein n=1 Tax=Melanomma pulvis-pyrius CBS 109.77 TaxID=1314802 RepID=A0A6A6XRB8_9PLEO|nr:cytochrome P450 monooxygenase-like protein [Melanomma pulvis-pyrius CBS 109.77]